MQIWRTLQSSSANGVGALVAVLVLGHTSTAAAQDAIGKEFSAQRFSPAPGPRNFITTRGVRTDGEMAWSAGLSLNYANTLIKVNSCLSDIPGNCAAGVQQRPLKVIENLAQADVMGSLTPIPKLQVGLRLPVAFANGNGIDENAQAKKVSKVGMADPELEVKYRVYGEVKDPIVAGVGAYFTAPMGHLTAPRAFLGDETPGAGIRAIFDGETGPVSFGANVGGIVRGTGRLGQPEVASKVGSELRWSVAGGFRPSPLFRVLVDGFGSTRFTSTAGENAIEIDAAAQLTPVASPLSFQAGAGFGPIVGFGVPLVRALLAASYTFEKRDRDDDGVDDALDQCPTEPEDKDGYEDSDGCPEADNDLDTIPDKADKCPNQAEDMDGFEDTDGCPDLDNDKDGIPDDQDRCPLEPETKNGFDDADGCPDAADRDRDGVPDDKDECVDEPETINKFEDEDGCPDDPKAQTKKAPKKEKKAAPPAQQAPTDGKVLEL